MTFFLEGMFCIIFSFCELFSLKKWFCSSCIAYYRHTCIDQHGHEGTAESFLHLFLNIVASASVRVSLFSSMCLKYCAVLSNDDLTQVSSSQNHSALSPVKYVLLLWANLILANFELLNLFTILIVSVMGFPRIEIPLITSSEKLNFYSFVLIKADFSEKTNNLFYLGTGKRFL